MRVRPARREPPQELAAPSRELSRPARSFRPRTRFVHGQRAPVQFLAIQRRDRILRGFIRLHRDEGKTARAARHPVGDKRDVADAPLFFKEVLEIVFSGLESEIPNIEFHSVIRIGKL